MLIEGRHVTQAPDSRPSTRAKRSRSGRRSQRSQRSSPGSADKTSRARAQDNTQIGQDVPKTEDNVVLSGRGHNVTESEGTDIDKSPKIAGDDTKGDTTERDGIYCEFSNVCYVC